MPAGGTRSAPSLIRPGTQLSRPGVKEGPLLAAAEIALSTGQPAGPSARTSAESRTSGAAPAVPRTMTLAQAWDEKTAPLTARTRPGSGFANHPDQVPRQRAHAHVCRSVAKAGTAVGETLDRVRIFGEHTCRRTGARASYSPQPPKPLTILMLQKACSNPPCTPLTGYVRSGCCRRARSADASRGMKPGGACYFDCRASGAVLHSDGYVSARARDCRARALSSRWRASPGRIGHSRLPQQLRSRHPSAAFIGCRENSAGFPRHSVPLFKNCKKQLPVNLLPISLSTRAIAY